MGRKSKRRRQNSSVSSPHANMSNTPPPSMSNLTYAVQNANETLYGPPHVIPPMFTNVSPTNSNMQMQLGPQMQTSTPIHSTFAQSNAPHILVNGQGQGHMNTQTTTTNQDMVFNLQTILNDIQSRLTKLNVLDSINDRLRNIEQRFEMVENDISQLKRSVTEHEKYLETNELQCRDFHARIQNFEIARDELDHRTKEIHETLLDQQTRSMKYNLIFENIPEVIPNTDMKEDTQQILKDFLQSELEIENVQFHNVHRLKPRRDRKPPSIVAKFIYNKDKDSVLKAARAKLVHKPFKIYQQYPQEISERRRVLVPTMKELRDQNRRAYIVKDKLYVDGRLYIPPEARVQNHPTFRDDPNAHRNADPRNQVRFS